MAVPQIHFRSISLPSRLHPVNSTGIESEVRKLRYCRSSCNTSETIQSGLLGLSELYNSVEEWTRSSATQRVGQSAEDSLDNSVELLDYCSTITELIQMMRESVQDLQSALRRKGLDFSMQNDIASYFCIRRNMNKCIYKSLKAVKNLETKHGSDVSTNRDENLTRALREISGTATAVFRSTLAFLSLPVVKGSGWNLVSRLMLTKSAASSKDHRQNGVTEVECVDWALNDLQKSAKNSELKVADREIVQKSLRNLESCLEGIEGGLEKLFRKMLQSRVTLLNIVTDH